MRVLLVHNFYQQRGGEDQVFADEAALLEAHGHQVFRYTVHNDDVTGMNVLALAKSTIWNTQACKAIRTRLHRHRPDVVHFHNTLPLISPAAYHAVRSEGFPVVQTLHNYRLLCPGVLFLRDDHVCEACLGRHVAWPGLVHGCYRGSRMATGAVTAMLAAHRALGTWHTKVNVYIAPSEFVRQKFVQGGIPVRSITVKPHFIYPEQEEGFGEGGYALFVGRLSREKGVDTLLSAWDHLASLIPLKIVGDGPLASVVTEKSRQRPEITWLGQQPAQEVLRLMGRASMVIVPSTSYETFGRTVIEAFAVGTPVVASNIGAIAELIDHERTGRLFQRGDPDDLMDQVVWMLTHPAQRNRMRKAVRAEYEEKYTAERNYALLMDIYTSTTQRIPREMELV